MGGWPDLPRSSISASTVYRRHVYTKEQRINPKQALPCTPRKARIIAWPVQVCFKIFPQAKADHSTRTGVGFRVIRARLKSRLFMHGKDGEVDQLMLNSLFLHHTMGRDLCLSYILILVTENRTLNSLKKTHREYDSLSLYVFWGNLVCANR